MKQIFLLCLLCFSINVVSGQVDTVEVYSKVMGRYDSLNLVITPTDYDVENDKLPVLYLLHGAGGYFSNWMFRVPEIASVR